MKRCSYVLLLGLPSCVLPPTEAEIATYKAIAPAYAAYVKADPTLTPEQVANRLDTVETWRIRVGAK